MEIRDRDRREQELLFRAVRRSQEVDLTGKEAKEANEREGAEEAKEEEAKMEEGNDQGRAQGQENDPPNHQGGDTQGQPEPGVNRLLVVEIDQLPPASVREQMNKLPPLLRCFTT